MPDVEIIIGSKNDLPKLDKGITLLSSFDIDYRVTVGSAHRSPKLVHEIVSSAEQRGVKVIIAAAGMAAHLAGYVAAHTTIPVIGLPLSGSTINGLDALLSTVQMPPGIPVATVAIDGSLNASMLACQILALNNRAIKQKIILYRQQQEEEILALAQ